MKLTRGDEMTFINYDLNKIVRKDHKLRAVEKLISFKEIAMGFQELEKNRGRDGYSVEVGVRSIFLQFFYDLSDREMEEAIKDNMAIKWFCGFEIEAKTPDHTYFCRIRKIIGDEKMAKIFKDINSRAKNNGILREVFVFVDSSKIITKQTTWEERDKAMKYGEEKINNENIKKYSADKDAKFGCNGKNKFWFGYKRHEIVDMGSGLIRNIYTSPANLPDNKAIKYICPQDAMVFGDKGYCVGEVPEVLRANNCHDGTIKKQNMKTKNKNRDKWISRVRAPYENVFSKNNNRSRYRGLKKVNFQVIIEAIVFNVKRLVVIGSPPLFERA